MREKEERSRPRAKAMRKAMTKAEVILWGNLRQLNTRGFKFRRQHPIGPFIADFAHIKGKLVIEIDGATHWSPEERGHDERRTVYLQDQGWTVLRFVNAEIYHDVSDVMERIVRRLREL